MKKNEDFKFTNDLIEFLHKSPTAFHAVKNISDELLKEGYTELFEGEEWTINPGKKYFVTRNQSSVIAFEVPNSARPLGYMIVASHSDSPCFKIKPHCEINVENKYVKLNIEKYGGMICSTWFDRPLSIAGKIMTETEYGVKSCLVNIEDDVVIIPSLAIHLNRDVNDNQKFNIQKDMLPLFGDTRDNRKSFSDFIGEQVGVKSNSIIGSDLFVYNRMKGTIFGRDSEYFASPRIDDLECAYISLQSFLKSKKSNSVKMMCVFDNEEVGSGTKQGALSTFLEDIIFRISECLNISLSDTRRMMSSSFMVSADNGHAVHPNYSDMSCPTNRPILNEGVLLKYNAQQKYTTDSVSEAIFKKICKSSDVPYQEYVNRSDILGGSTLGNLSASHISIKSVDIGLAQLAMHSSYETAGVKDTEYMLSFMTTFYGSSIVANPNTNGDYSIKI